MNNWKSGCCETNGITLHYTRSGGNKPAIILLHGLTANGICWTEVARALETDYDVIMPDLRGHGLSNKPNHGYQYEDLANDVVGLIKELHLSSTILIGHSMGGMVAALVASRSPMLPHAVILADPTFLNPELQREVYNSGAADQHQHYLTLALEEIIAEARAKHLNRSYDTIKRIAQARLQTSLAAFDILTPPNPDYQQMVSSIMAPTLLVIGGPTGVVSPDTAAHLQHLNPRLQVEQIPDVGHGLIYDQPERFAELVSSFLHTHVSG